MNLNDTKYKDFALVQEMLRAPEIIGNFDFGQTQRVIDSVKETNRFFLTGEGSSRIFPAKRFIASLLGRGLNVMTATDGARQALEYDLSAWTVIGTSNSGQTKELITLFQKLNAENHTRLFGLTANAGTKLTEVADSMILSCGKENAVAATMSVVEQALVYQSIEVGLADCHCGCTERKSEAGQLAANILAEEYNTELIKKTANAPVIYLAGRNNGVAEELALKTNEITRKRSQFLEGTIVVHGIEEVMNPEDVVVLIEPFEQDAEFYKKNLVDGVGLTVIAVSSKPTLFETILIPSLPRYNEYFQLLAGWNLLVQTGVACGINIDKPKRARKVGNAF
ncbi:MAG: sugar isomerase [Planctomycetaceae bacterium]|jgi:glucosamine--fructose-6-phosphate aminotransferase (isomerizing)|nr:sugar isomerase [Planctomycetaceae bacterium]